MGNLSQKDQLYLEKETHHDQVQEDHPIFSCKIWMDLIHQTRNSNNSNKCVQCAPYLHGMDCISKYIEVKIKDKVANIRWPTLDALARTTSNFWTLSLQENHIKTTVWWVVWYSMQVNRSTGWKKVLLPKPWMLCDDT